MHSSRLILLAFISISLLPRVVGQSTAAPDLPSAPSAVSQEKKNQEKAQQNAPAVQGVTPTQTPSSPPSGPPNSATSAPQNPASVAPSGTETGLSSSDEPTVTFRRRVNEVNVVFTVTDKHGRYVNDLTKNDFSIIDDQKPALEVRSFHRETDLPLQVGLLVDASNSVRDRFKFEQEAAIEFLNETIRPRYDQAFIVGFDVTPEVTQDFTDNTDLLSVGVRGLRPGGGTALYDALYFACRDKLLKAPQTGPLRRAIILLSDGDDNQSHVTREEAVEMAQRADVSIYAISTNINGGGSHGDKILERIADATGGRAFFPFQLREVATLFPKSRTSFAASMLLPTHRQTWLRMEAITQ